MTKNEIIRELTKCDPRNIRNLYIIYHNKSNGVRYVFSYYYKSASLVENERELARVLLSLYKLRRHIITITASFFPLQAGDSPLDIFFDSCNHYVFNISDFIKTIKK